MTELADIARAFDRVVDYAEREPWKSLRDRCVHDALGAEFEYLGVDLERLIERLHTLRVAQAFNHFCLVQTLCTTLGERQQNPIDEFLKLRGLRESRRARRYLRALRASAARLFEVAQVESGEIRLRDLIGRQEWALSTRAEDRHLVGGERLAARLIEVDGEVMLADGMLRYPSEANRRLDALLRRAHDSAAGTAPAGSIGWPLLLQIWIRTLLDRSEHPAAELRNIDGESLVYARAEFELASRDPGAVAHHLDAMPGWAREQFDELKWTRSEMRARSGASESDDDSEFVRTVLANARIAAGKLTVDANSRERMRRVLAELTSTLRGLVRPPTVTEEEAR